MKTYNSLSSMQTDPAVPESVYNFMDNVVNGTKEYTEEEDEVAKDFNLYLGGQVKLVESFEDLKLVPTIEESKLDKQLQLPDLQGWASILETASSYDLAEKLPEGDFIVMFIATNNAGGDSYFIPTDIADQCPNIELSIKITAGEY